MLVPCRRGRPAVHAAEEGRPAGRPRLTARSAPSMRVLTRRPGAAPPPQAMERRSGPARCVRPPAPPRPPHGYGCVPPHQAPQIAAGRAEVPGGAVGPREVCGSAPAPSRAAPGLATRVPSARCAPPRRLPTPRAADPAGADPTWARVSTRVARRGAYQSMTAASGAANGFRWAARSSPGIARLIGPFIRRASTRIRSLCSSRAAGGGQRCMLRKRTVPLAAPG
jgi:hypothetical protein